MLFQRSPAAALQPYVQCLWASDERGGRVRDPWGHEWLIGHQIEEVTPEEMQRRYDALMKGS
jgi:hypothetical protein